MWFSVKAARALSRCVAAGRASGLGPAANAVARRRYGDDSAAKFVKSAKYKVFRDDDSSVILDVEEERALLRSRLTDGRLDDDHDDDDDDDDELFAGLNTSRGVSGVFEVEHLVEVLEKNNASDIFVVSVPANVRYVDYIVIASGRSQKHLMSIAEFVRKLFKKKRKPTDRVPLIVNKKPLDWVALDIGNIALHLLTKNTRNNFDLETIWSVGEKFDSHLNRPTDSLVALLDEHSFSLDNLVPADAENVKTR